MKYIPLLVSTPGTIRNLCKNTLFNVKTINKLHSLKNYKLRGKRYKLEELNSSKRLVKTTNLLKINIDFTFKSMTKAMRKAYASSFFLYFSLSFSP